MSEASTNNRAAFQEWLEHILSKKASSAVIEKLCVLEILLKKNGVIHNRILEMDNPDEISFLIDNIRSNKGIRIHSRSRRYSMISGLTKYKEFLVHKDPVEETEEKDKPSSGINKSDFYLWMTENKGLAAPTGRSYASAISRCDSLCAEHNIGIGDLLDEIVKDFNEFEEEYQNLLKFCVIGRPNVGKSSLVNALLNEERVIVSDNAGTTRDAVDTLFTYDKKEYVLIDTAGMRKKGKIYESTEKYSLIRSMRAIDRSDVCLIVLNAFEGIIEHDKHIAGYALESGKAVVLVVNKWDTVENKNEIRKFKEEIKNNFKFMPYAPIVFLSALTKKRIHTLMPEVLKAYENTTKEIKTSLLNNVIMDAVSLNPPPSYKGKRLKIYFTSQTGTKPPKFTFNVNNKGLVHFSYERYLENKIRENFDFEGTPIILQFKNRGEEQ